PCDLALAICKARLCWYYVAHPGTTRDPPPFPTRRSSDLNPGASLPATDIVVVHRSDGSGTSYGFTDYLSKVSSDWAQKVGKGTSVNWPVGLGGKGNEGVAATVNQTPGGIGYVELAYATSNKMAYGQVRNSAGK